ncbi:UDP-glucose 4-epimerase GalE [Maricaulis sp.]|uniref:UDP-glucose 4-epimerase GalE n=2 Tax=Maricaulis sp. TaxID=1486257 RepID=UPI0032998AA8
MSRKHILLTGGAGYIGSHCAAELLEHGHEVVILDNFSNARRDVVDRIGQAAGRPAPRVVEADIRDRTAIHDLMERSQFDAVMHFAGLKSVSDSVSRPAEYFDVNVGGLVTVIQAMKSNGVRKLVFSSSATVYDLGAGQGAIREDAPFGPNNPYGQSKLMAEQVLQAQEAAAPDWSVGILRYFNPAGAHPSGLIGECPADPPDNLLPYIAQVAAGQRQYLGIFGDDWDTPDGTGVRDYVHITDLARGHLASLDALERDGHGHVVNLGTGRGLSVQDVRRAYEHACGREIPFRILPRRPGDVASCYCDTQRARDVLGFEARQDVDAICASSWKWVRHLYPEVSPS